MHAWSHFKTIRTVLQAKTIAKYQPVIVLHRAGQLNQARNN